MLHSVKNILQINYGIIKTKPSGNSIGADNEFFIQLGMEPAVTDSHFYFFGELNPRLHSPYINPGVCYKRISRIKLQQQAGLLVHCCFNGINNLRVRVEADETQNKKGDDFLHVE